MLYAAGSGQRERERTLLTISYPDSNMPTTGYNYSLQTKKKSVMGERNEPPEKPDRDSTRQHLRRKLKEVGDLIRSHFDPEGTTCHRSSPLIEPVLQGQYGG
jgi:hypothetical protein